MPRQKNYRREDAIEKAKAAFWQYGYQSLGIRAIEELTGLKRFAIRTDFGGKEGLFLEVLNSYTADFKTYIAELLQASRRLEAIADMLEYLVTPAEDSCRPFGCLVTNTSIESASVESDAIKQHTDQHLALLREVVFELLTQQQMEKALKPDLNIHDATEFVVGAVLAINVMNRQANSIEAGRGYANIAIQTVNSWAN